MNNIHKSSHKKTLQFEKY
ncbi:hypothetical protein D910_08707 [Dendroctonus ponderosae]|uniref:Uncharacterized protein n=1 Tax=Dendroctonus ponderosae TaxID=77166 RepID=U4UMZ7_DENPD|nr:hypothetical protein D910_08707 [Dendroctonus ponderosae]